MNLKKTRLWLALTGWLPWSCYFGIHDVRLIARRNERFLLDPRTGCELIWESKRCGEFTVQLCVCKRCGLAW